MEAPRAFDCIPLHVSETAFRALTDALPAIVFVADTLGQNRYANEAAVAYSSIPRDAMLGEGWLKALHPDDRSVALSEWRRALASGNAIESEFRLRRYDGDYRTHACRTQPVRDEAGNLIAWYGVCTDVEEHRRTLAALRDKVDDLQTLLDTLPIGVFIAHDEKCRRITGNRAAARLLRLPLEANLSKSAKAEDLPLNFRILSHGREIPTDELPVQRAARGEVVEGVEVDHEFTDGTLVQTVISAHPLYDEEGRPRGAVAAIVDVTGLKTIQASDRRKAEFLAELSHELRDPLAPLTTALELLRRARHDPALVENLAATMSRQLGHLVSLVDDLLDVARIGRGEIRLHLESADLRDVVRNAIEMVQPLIVERGHQLIVEQNASPVKVMVDRRRLTQVITNLLANAARYSDAGGAIAVRIELEERRAVLRVKDTGFGIPPDRLNRIFETFFQLPEHRKKARGGLGLGLALARQISILHGGSIEAYSEGLGRGSEFVVRLPVVEEQETRGEVSSAPERPASSSRRRVLVVDDNVDAAETLRMWLEVEGHDVEVVHDGEAALQAVESHAPEIVLLDIGLPLADGHEVARRIRAMSGRNVRLIALTGWGQPDDRRRSLEAGFDDHLVKPVKGVQLRAVLEGSAA